MKFSIEITYPDQVVYIEDVEDYYIENELLVVYAKNVDHIIPINKTIKTTVQQEYDDEPT